jgi:hypothetical protein
MKNLQLYEYYGSRGEHADKEERMELLMEAQVKLNEAIDLIEQGLKGTSHERYANSYIISHLRNWVDASGYDMGIQQYIDKIEQEGEEEDYDGEE